MPTTRTASRNTLLRYWTVRYVITLSIGLLIIGISSIAWLKHEALTRRLHHVQSFAQEAAQYVTTDRGNMVVPDQFYEWIDLNQRRHKLPGQFGLTLFNQAGDILFYKSAPVKVGPSSSKGAKPAPPPYNLGKQVPSANRPDTHTSEGSSYDPAFPFPPPLEDTVIINEVDYYYQIIVPVRVHHSVIGTIAISYAKKELTDISQQYGLIISLLLLSGLLGWLILYLLLRKLTKPIHEVVQAFKRIEAGDYRLLLQEHVKEQEIYDLLVYFNVMAARLEQLEQLRAELIAGVTHELRTPITSIRGLTRAVRDQIVASSEADEFLDISLNETKRLEQMVSDLLDFNSFISGNIRIHLQAVDLGKLLSDIIHHWSLIYQDDSLVIQLDIPARTQMVYGDTGRIQQIIVNLLHNSRQAIGSNGKISISLSEYSSTHYEVQFKDNGLGIPIGEQLRIFERYYRGQNKKPAVHGLGLGLTISRMLAEAMSGTLILVESSPQGTTFQLLLSKVPENMNIVHRSNCVQ
ncbi:HAMP domain-containing histidine kinase [Paenibacillus sp. ACRRX]|uniref:HAMP domain-containing sensor histidine kinase n=1 Tax=Paenibacillus sp. ACRRX TaxID=2918206 RepID=UPI001EF7526E|nr:HAMP domain-containing sensor histidine kinase [Paenibacillus sp. ACRRX]MCG7406644.1 HAMP domain-containing histidine kinase [Paenibacillus sp. ACRRX]